MAWPSEQREQTRQRILESAARMFALQGFDAVNINDLMADAGLTRGAFYHHFSTKTELYAQAIAHAARLGSARLDAQGAAGLGLLVEHYLSLGHAQGTDLRCPMAFMASDVTRGESEVRSSYTRVFDGFVDRLQAGLPEGSSQARQRSLRLAATLIGGVALARALDDPGLADELLRACRAGARELIEAGD